MTGYVDLIYPLPLRWFPAGPRLRSRNPAIYVVGFWPRMLFAGTPTLQLPTLRTNPRFVVRYVTFDYRYIYRALRQAVYYGFPVDCWCCGASC